MQTPELQKSQRLILHRQPPVKANKTSIKKWILIISLIVGTFYNCKLLLDKPKDEDKGDKAESLPFIKDYLKTKYESILKSWENFDKAVFSTKKMGFTIEKEEVIYEKRKHLRTIYASKIEEDLTVLLIISETPKKNKLTFTIEIF